MRDKSATSSSPDLDRQVRACLTTNIRDLTGIPTLIGLAKKVPLVEVSDQELRDEATRLYDTVDRLRAILNGCDPKLARELMADQDREVSSNQPYYPTGFSDPVAQSRPLTTISTCHGRSGNARFRSAPTLADWAILGELSPGDRVDLTGRMREADGVVWHEAIARSAGGASNNPISPNQVGWLADCFVR